MPGAAGAAPRPDGTAAARCRAQHPAAASKPRSPHRSPQQRVSRSPGAGQHPSASGSLRARGSRAVPGAPALRLVRGPASRYGSAGPGVVASPRRRAPRSSSAPLEPRRRPGPPHPSSSLPAAGRGPGASPTLTSAAPLCLAPPSLSGGPPPSPTRFSRELGMPPPPPPPRRGRHSGGAGDVGSFPESQ